MGKPLVMRTSRSPWSRYLVETGLQELLQYILQSRLKRHCWAQVLSMECEECGKPCRSQTEQDLHTKRTGMQHLLTRCAQVHACMHSRERRWCCIGKSCVIQTSEAMAIDTESQMQAASAEIREEMAGPSKPMAIQVGHTSWSAG